MLYISGMAGTYRTPQSHVSVVPPSRLIMQRYVREAAFQYWTQ